VKAIVIVSAVLLALLGLLPSPNPSDQLAGKILIAIAAGFVLLALYAPTKVTASIYFGALALVVIAYSLPMSFWRMMGLAKEQPTEQHRPESPADDR
jgi:hypothetical protein